MRVRLPHRSDLSYFLPVSGGENENAAQQDGENPAFTLALLQHSANQNHLDGRGCLYFRSQALKIDRRAASGKSRLLGTGQIMDELIGRLASKAGIDSAVAEKTIGIVLDFLRNEGPSDKVRALIDQIPGAEAAIAASGSNSGFARFMGGGLMAVGTRLMALGLSMNEIQSVARELFRFGRDKIGADQMSEIISGTPGLSQFA
jgi:hypothetical protein